MASLNGQHDSSTSAQEQRERERERERGDFKEDDREKELVIVPQKQLNRDWKDDTEPVTGPGSDRRTKASVCATPTS